MNNRELVAKNNREREQEYLKQSREVLRKMCTAKIRTTMIGSLDCIERTFGAQIESNDEIRNLYEGLRKDILDKGNDQIRLLESELERFEVKWLRYYTEFRVLD